MKLKLTHMLHLVKSGRNNSFFLYNSSLNAALGSMSGSNSSE